MWPISNQNLQKSIEWTFFFILPYPLTKSVSTWLAIDANHLDFISNISSVHKDSLKVNAYKNQKFVLCCSGAINLGNFLYLKRKVIEDWHKTRSWATDL